MRALLITTSADLQDPPLRHITEILRRADVEPVTSGALGAGSYLRGQLRPGVDISIGIVILPRHYAEHRGSLALMVEAGICLGADIPLLTIVHPDEKLPPALASIRHVKARLNDTDALQLHLGMFIRSTASLKARPVTSSPQLVGPHLMPPALPDDAGWSAYEGFGLVERTIALLRSAGKEPVLGDLDYGADMAFVAGDDEPFVVVVEAKTIGPHTQARSAVDQLHDYVDRSGAGLGLLVTDQAVLSPRSFHSHPEVLQMSIQELADIVAAGGLDNRIRSARNRIVHQG